ncbi:MAG: hypothetical protein DRH97_01865 [Chloroflexi bacterium]|nr:MAG: hypothetical protein DRH97_01865 [Chloroflexota bacterium]
MPGTKKDDDKVAPVDAPTKTPADPADKAGDDAIKKDDAVDLGDFKTPAELKTAYDKLQTKYGEQSTEVGGLRKTQTDLTDKLTKAEKAAEPEPKTDYEAQLKEIRTKVDDGSLTIAEGMEEQGRLITEKTAAETVKIAEEKTKELLLDRDAQTAEKEWHKKYPDYQEFIDSGEAATYMADNPMLIDPTMAYLMDRETKAHKAGMDAQVKLEKGTELTEKVLDEPGAVPPRTPTRQTPVSDDELEKIQLGTISKMRGEAT